MPLLQGAQSAYYHITKPEDSTGQPRPIGDADLIVEAPWGTWNGLIATPLGENMPAGCTTMVLGFEFSSPDYFSDTNGGHFAIAIRGVAGDGLLGRGIIIGNVTGLPPGQATQQTNTLAVESFWKNGAHVYGPETEGPALHNDVEYRLSLECSLADASLIAYVLEEKVRGKWAHALRREVRDRHGRGKVDSQYGGFFIAEVFSEHRWQMNIRDLKVVFH
ncbi:MAG: hypothetical protein ABWY06_16590 [Pseudomonas sp.]|uniref:hypothetical protein n=1 Tax=Pseudomonas sp. TaxID=306 RepID=UPI0033977F91